MTFAEAVEKGKRIDAATSPKQVLSEAVSPTDALDAAYAKLRAAGDAYLAKKTELADARSALDAAITNAFP